MSEEMKKLIDGIKAIACLIDESQGVIGLHLNGDIADWESLRSGGRFEAWLSDFDEALEIVDALDKEPLDEKTK